MFLFPEMHYLQNWRVPARFLSRIRNSYVDFLYGTLKSRNVYLGLYFMWENLCITVNMGGYVRHKKKYIYVYTYKKIYKYIYIYIYVFKHVYIYIYIYALLLISAIMKFVLKCLCPRCPHVGSNGPCVFRAYAWPENVFLINTTEKLSAGAS